MKIPNHNTTTNYLDSRTPDERRADNKIKATTTVSKEKEQCPFNHRELPNCDVCKELGCNHLKETPQQGDWEKELEDADFLHQQYYADKLKGAKSFISAQIKKAKEEALKEAIAYLKKKNPVRVPSSVMVDYTEAITDLEKLAQIIKNKLK